MNSEAPPQVKCKFEGEIRDNGINGKSITKYRLLNMINKTISKKIKLNLLSKLYNLFLNVQSKQFQITIFHGIKARIPVSLMNNISNSLD